MKFKVIIFVFLIGVFTYYNLEDVDNKKSYNTEKIISKTLKSSYTDYIEQEQFIEMKNSQKRSLSKTLKISLTGNKKNKSDLIQKVRMSFEKLKHELNRTQNYNVSDENNITILMYATLLKDYDFVQKLIDMGADINTIGKDGTTALLSATMVKDIKAIKLLVENGAKINQNGSYNPILLSAKMNNLQFVEYFVEHGADIEAKTPEGRTAISGALNHGNIEMVKYLIREGAYTSAVDNIGLEPIMFTKEPDSLKKIKAIEQTLEYDLAGIKNNYTSLLMNTVGDVESDTVQYLIDRGQDVNYINKKGQTPLFNATYYGNLDSMKILIDNGANVDAYMNDSNESILTVAVGIAKKSAKNTKAVKLLVDNGVDINVVTAKGNSPLILAVQKGKYKIVKILLDSGADISIVNNQNKSALDYAKLHNDQNMINLLTH